MAKNQLDKRKKILLIAFVVIIMVVAIMFWPKNKESQEQKGMNGANDGGLGGGSPRDTPLGGGVTGGGIVTNPNTGGGGYVPVNPAFPLKNGSRGNEVKNLQKMINHSNSFFARGRQTLVEDGIFGAKTEAELQYWWGIKQCIEGDYNAFWARYSSGVPAFYLPESWPLYIRQRGPNVRKLNEALGVYAKGSSDKKADIFGENTRRAVEAKTGYSTVSENVLGQIYAQYIISNL